MERFLSLAVIGCSLSLVEAGSFRWNSDNARDLAWTPVRETPGINANLQTLAMNPAPTNPPELKKERMAKRLTADAASMCGYFGGDIDYPYACAIEDECLFATISGQWVAGCCAATSTNCPLPTTCIDSAAAAQLTSTGDYTYLCTDSEYPNCVTLTYGDMVGYSIMGCGKTAVSTFQLIDYNPTSSSTSTDTTTTTSSSSSSGSTTTHSSTSSSSTVTPTPAPATASKSVPIGPIVGGVVGGVAVIALLILGIIFLCRKKKNNGMNFNGKPHAAIHGQPPIGYSPQQAMQQQQNIPQQQNQQQLYPQPGPGFGENRSSIQKPPYNVHTQSVYGASLSSPGSPPPLSPSPGSGTLPAYVPPVNQQSVGYSPTDPALLAHQNSGSNITQGYQQQEQQQKQQHQQHQQQTTNYHEMSASRGDGELRELA